VRQRYLCAGFKRSHYRRYGMNHLAPVVTSGHTSTKAAELAGPASQDCEFLSCRNKRSVH
jgi:hypothetical protein